jgi:hypothetical protein
MRAKVEENSNAHLIGVMYQIQGYSRSFSMKHHSVKNTFTAFLIIYYKANSLHIQNIYNATVFSATCFGS